MDFIWFWWDSTKAAVDLNTVMTFILGAVIGFYRISHRTRTKRVEWAKDVGWTVAPTVAYLLLGGPYQLSTSLKAEIATAKAQTPKILKGPYVVKFDPVIRPDRLWETVWRDETDQLRVKVELRPAQPPTQVMDLHVTFSDGKSEAPSALARWVQIETPH